MKKEVEAGWEGGHSAEGTAPAEAQRCQYVAVCRPMNMWEKC